MAEEPPRGSYAIKYVCMYVITVFGRMNKHPYSNRGIPSCEMARTSSFIYDRFDGNSSADMLEKSTLYLNNRVFRSRNYRLIVAPWKFDVLKTNICPRSEASRANMLVLRTSNFQGATIRPIDPRQKHSIVFIVHHFLPHTSSKIN